MSPGFELTEHTADIGIRAWGPSAADVFEQAALAMVSLLYDTGCVAAVERLPFEVEAPDGELLLAAWLNELLFVVESRRTVFAAFEVLELGPLGEDGAPATRCVASAGGTQGGVTPERKEASPQHPARPGSCRDLPVGVPWRLRAAGVGEALDARRHTYHALVKAATLHQLTLACTGGVWEGRVLLDV